ncbi:MAG: aconitate hydratase AcnA [Thermoplasmata archaeon]
MNDYKKKIKIGRKSYEFFSLKSLKEKGFEIDKIPYSMRILLENLLRRLDNSIVTEEHIKAIVERNKTEIPFFPERIILQDYTGVPVVLDLVAMRNAVTRLGKDSSKINPIVPVDLVIDHSIQVDKFGTTYSLRENMEIEFERNEERYKLLKWAQKNFNNFRVVPPGNGIIHQVNTEYLSSIVIERNNILFPETLIGTDSHTTMINGIGIVGWGVGGLEAEAAMVGEPLFIELPEVIGVKLVGTPKEGVTATDIVLTITQFLRKKNVVGKFVEFVGPGLSTLTAQDRTTIANMAPEYGATIGFFPVDERTLEYLELTGRRKELIKLVEKYLKEQGLFYSGEDGIKYDDLIEFDLSTVEPSIAGPRNPDEKILLKESKEKIKALAKEMNVNSKEDIVLDLNGQKTSFGNYSIVIAAITSCTNTSNPFVLFGAGLMAKKAVEFGLRIKPYVKTSLAPGSTVVKDYLEKAGLMPYLESLGFHIVGFGCTTCIGNSGPLIKEVEEAIKKNDYFTAAILSGNRNFEGRINPYVKGAFIASPMLVIAYAIAGRIDIDFQNEPIGYDPNGRSIYLRDIWPSNQEILNYVKENLGPSMYIERYAHVFEGNDLWKRLEIQDKKIYTFDEKSTYIREPPWFKEINVREIEDIKNARILAIFGDNITTDHISPAGVILPDISLLKNVDLKNKETLKNLPPAAIYLLENGVKPEEFNTYGSRRGNHEVMVRGGFANIKIKNKMVEIQGGYTKYYPSGELMTIYDASMKYQKDGIPLVIFAGKRYGQGSSRDWAAKATALLGVKAVIAEGFERIHRSNLVDMGVIPIEIDKLPELKGDELINIYGLNDPTPNKIVNIILSDGREIKGKLRLDTLAEIEYVKNGGILIYTLKKILKEI